IGDGNEKHVDAETLRLQLAVPNAERIFYIGQAFHRGMSLEEIYELTKIDRWFLRNVEKIVRETGRLSSTGILPVGPTGVPPVEAKSHGTSRGMDPHGEVQITRRNLPHWRQPGAAYFVTFRLADAVPATLLREWKEELETWRKFHPEPWDTAT